MIVFNQVQDNTEIDIIGAIGEDFWGDGNTLASVKAEVDQITTPNITVNRAINMNVLYSCALWVSSSTNDTV